VADWRLKKPEKRQNPARHPDLEFVLLNLQVLRCEDRVRAAIIEGSSDYYSSGILPECVKSIAERPKAVIAETTDGLSPPGRQ
jgi:hypothetical protein